MTAFQMFLSPDDLEHLIHDLAEQHGLIGVSDTFEGMRPYSPAHASAGFLSEPHSVKFYLFPSSRDMPSSLENANPKEEGWIDIMPVWRTTFKGVPVLRMTTIQAKDGAGAYRPVAWIKKLLHQNPDLKFGVDSHNLKDGGHHHHKDVGYSRKAQDLFEQGTRWRYDIDGILEFRPAIIESE